MQIHRRKLTIFRNISPLAIKAGLILLGLMLLSDIVVVRSLTQIEAILSLPAIHATTTVPTRSATLTISPVGGQQPTLAQDSFLRANQSSWGIASDGQRWQADAMNSPSFAIRNHEGLITNGSGIYDAILGPLITDAEVVFSGSLSRFGQSTLGALLRWVNANNLYKAYLDGSHLILLKDIAGKVTVLNSMTFPAQDGKSYTFRFRILGSSLSARVWPTGTPEPANWMVATTDTSLSSGYGGIRVILQNGISATITSFTEAKL